jgi:SAM-dependent methyltransferase
MVTSLQIPEELHRNHPSITAAGYDYTGEALINLALLRVGLTSLENTDVLDVGCGVRFTATIINRNIPIKSYTGVEVHKPIVDFLNEKVALHDKRFRFVHWNVHNEMYNPDGIELSTLDKLPFPDTFDLIWLFSVFTHLNPVDSRSLLKILRRHIRQNGKLLFSAFIDETIEGFEDRVQENPLLNAYYGRTLMELLIKQGGWNIDGFFNKDSLSIASSGERVYYIQHHFVCSP